MFRKVVMQSVCSGTGILVSWYTNASQDPEVVDAQPLTVQFE